MYSDGGLVGLKTVRSTRWMRRGDLTGTSTSGRHLSCNRPCQFESSQRLTRSHSQYLLIFADRLQIHYLICSHSLRRIRSLDLILVSSGQPSHSNSLASGQTHPTVTTSRRSPEFCSLGSLSRLETTRCLQSPRRCRILTQRNSAWATRHVYLTQMICMATSRTNGDSILSPRLKNRGKSRLRQRKT